MNPLPCHNWRGLSMLLVAGAAVAHAAAPQVSDSRFYDAMRWRLIGPTRAGRTSAVTGVPGDPTIYYVGTLDGGLWKTTDGGTVWSPILDALRVPSIGAVAVAASDPPIVYVGTGHNLIGKGVFRSNDAGRTWHSAGLADTKYITAILVDPKNPDVVLAGVGAGGNFGTMVYYSNNPSAARGIYRTTDGGRTWSLAIDVVALDEALEALARLDPRKSRVVELRYFGGLTLEETAGVLCVSVTTARRPELADDEGAEAGARRRDSGDNRLEAEDVAGRVADARAANERERSARDPRRVG